MEPGPKSSLLILLVVGFGLYSGSRVVSTPREQPVVATVADETSASATPVQAAGPSEEPGYVVSYEVQACVDDKATITIQADKIMWNEMTGEGLDGVACPPTTKNKTTVIARTLENPYSEPSVFEALKPGEYYGSLKNPLPAQELMYPAELKILSSDNTSGRVTLVEEPKATRYAARIAFEDNRAHAHEYVVLLILKYKKAPPDAVAR